MSAASTSRGRGLRATSSIRLRTDVFDAACAELEANTDVDRSRLCGMSRYNLSRIRNGHIAPSLELAMNMADRLGMKVEELFEQVA